MRLLALDCYEATETQIMTISGQTRELLWGAMTLGTIQKVEVAMTQLFLRLKNY